MSPEPTQEPIEENLTAPNLNVGIRMTNDSDSDEEDVGMAGYVPLSQIPDGSDPVLEDDDDEEDEWISSGDTSQVLRVTNMVSQQEYPSETIEVWSSSCSRSNIDMDAEKISQVKSVMANFTLPNAAIPEWANVISEDQWKEQLIDRIKEIQNREK